MQAVVKRRKRFMAVSLDLNRIFFEYPFLVPDYFALITRAMIVLEGIAVTGDPEFDLFSAAYPYTARSDYCHFRRNTLLTTDFLRFKQEGSVVVRTVQPDADSQGGVLGGAEVEERRGGGEQGVRDESAVDVEKIYILVDMTRQILNTSNLMLGTTQYSLTHARCIRKQALAYEYSSSKVQYW